MRSTVTQKRPFKLSICIATYNREGLIGATLDSILSQITKDCEIVVSDNASTDETEAVVSQYACRFDHIRYIKQSSNVGLDRNFDRAVELAHGEYCWLMPDDDILKPGAIAAVLEALSQGYSLVVVNAEFRDVTMSKVVLRHMFKFETDRIYRSDDSDRLFEEVSVGLQYIGCIIIKRIIWLIRDRHKYYGTSWIHLGVIFQERLPGDTLVLAAILVAVRFGDQSWFPKAVEVTMNLRKIRWSLAPSEAIRKKITHNIGWKDSSALLMLRACDHYSLSSYQRDILPQSSSLHDSVILGLVAVFPRSLANCLLVLRWRLSKEHLRDGSLLVLRKSRFHVRNWRVSRAIRSIRTGVS